MIADDWNEKSELKYEDLGRFRCWQWMKNVKYIVVTLSLMYKIWMIFIQIKYFLGNLQWCWIKQQRIRKCILWLCCLSYDTILFCLLSTELGTCTSNTSVNQFLAVNSEDKKLFSRNSRTRNSRKKRES